MMARRMIAASRRLWTPREITTALWFDASDSSTVSVSNGKVTSVTDKSGNSRSLGTISNREPEYLIADKNGLNVFRFNYSSQSGQLFRNTAAALPFSSHSFFIVCEETAYIESAGIFQVNTSLGLIDYASQVGSVFSLGGLSSARGRYLAGSLALNDMLGQPMPLGIYSCVVSSSANMYDNGELVSTDASVSLASSSSHGFYLGSRAYNDFNLAFRGKICELVYLGSVINEADRLKMEGYLAHKWGLASNLPANHSYKSHPPRV